MKLIIKHTLIVTFAMPALTVASVSTPRAITVTTFTNDDVEESPYVIFADSHEAIFSIYGANDTVNFELSYCGYRDKKTGLIWSEKTYLCGQGKGLCLSNNIEVKLNDTKTCKARLPSAQELITLMDWSKNPVNRLGNAALGVTLTKGGKVGFQTMKGKKIYLSNNSQTKLKRYARFIVSSK